jgi:transposase
LATLVSVQPIETVIAVLAAARGGASINAAAKASGIKYRTAQRIVEAAAEKRLLLLVGRLPTVRRPSAGRPQ